MSHTDDALREVQESLRRSQGRNGVAGDDAQVLSMAPPNGKRRGRAKVVADPAPDGDVHHTDLGNAGRLLSRHGSDMRFIHPWNKWLVWDGRRWAEDNTAEAVRRAKDSVTEFYRAAAVRLAKLAGQEGPQAAAARVAAQKDLNWALKSEDARRIAASLELARSEPGIPALPEQLDADGMLLSVLNGTIDLRTGQLRPHRREDLLTKLAPVTFDPAAACPLWERCVDQWMDGNGDLAGYLRRVVGYCLTGDVSEQVLWFFHGQGANGKSTFLQCVLSLLGDYGMQSVSDLLMVKNHEAHPTERADLFGRRFVATIETEEGKRMAEALMKQMTGGDKVRARKMRQDFFEFQPTHKIVLAANHRPAVRGTDHAVWRRIKLVPFVVTIPNDEKDKALPAKLRAEASGILNWALAGCAEWRKGGLGEPDEVRQATAAYQHEQDTVAKFLAECCVVQSEAKVKVSALFEAYGRWSGDKFMTQPAFNERVKSKGYEAKRETRGYFWRGLTLGDHGEANEPV